MGGERIKVGNLREQSNYVPLPYRRVSYQPYSGPMNAKNIVTHLLSREVYRRTDIIVLHNEGPEFAVAAVHREEPES